MENFKHPDDDLHYRKAKKKANEIRGFYYNLACYCIVIPMLVVINLVYVPEFIWFYFSMIGWGIGLMFHAIGAFGYNPLLGRGWEERQLKKFMDEEKERRNNIKN